LIQLRQLVDVGESLFLESLATFDAMGDAELLAAAPNAVSWLQGTLHLSAADAAQKVRVARASPTLLAKPCELLARGELSFAHVAAIERTVRDLPSATVEEAVTFLTDLAPSLDPARLRKAGRALRHTVDPDGAYAESQRQFDRRYLHLSPLLDGMTALDGMFDSESAAILATALAPFLVPTGDEDARTTSQRRADGLVEVASTAMSSDQLPGLGGAPAHLQVLVPLASLLNEKGAPATTLPDSLSNSGLLTPIAAQRIGCDARVTRLILGPDSVPLDVGRTQRLFTSGQRCALAVRDAGCRFPGCTRAPRYTDAHHIVPWQSGGATDLINGCLLCRFHHRVVHEGPWRIEAEEPDAGANGRLWLLGPSHCHLSSDPRGP
jgi:hypothetical protein